MVHKVPRQGSNKFWDPYAAYDDFLMLFEKIDFFDFFEIFCVIFASHFDFKFFAIPAGIGPKLSKHTPNLF